MLKELAIVFGLLLVISRGLCVISPDSFRTWVKEVTGSRVRLGWTGLFLLLFSCLILVVLGGDWSGARVLMGIVGTIGFLGSLMLIFIPDQYARLADSFIGLSDMILRFLGTIGVAFGILILILGMHSY